MTDHEIVPIVLAHRAIAAEAHALRVATEGPIVIDHLDRMRAALQAHFELEQASGGFLDALGSRQPHLHQLMERLVHEHEVLLGELDALRARAATGDVTRDVAGWLDRLMRHEDREARLARLEW